MGHSRRTSGRRPRPALATAAAATAAGLLGFNLWLETRDGERLRDLHHGVLRDQLKLRIAESPDAPLVLVMGTSRAAGALDFRHAPDIRTGDGRPCLAFNFSRGGAGAWTYRLALERLERDGVRPSAVVFELIPTFLWRGREQAALIAGEGAPGLIGAADLPVLGERLDPADLYPTFVSTRLGAWHAFRHALLYRLRPDWLPRETFETREAVERTAIPPGGWPGPTALPPGRLLRARAKAREEYAALGTPLPAGRPYEQSLRSLLAWCAERGIPAALYVGAEGPDFAGLYSESTRRDLDAWMHGFGLAAGTPVIDGRDWLSAHAFYDGHHLYEHGAGRFTLAFAEAVVEPLVQGRLTPGLHRPRPPASRIGIRWAGDFHTPERVAGRDHRWCGPAGELILDNREPRPVIVQCSMTVATGHPACSGTLRIRGGPADAAMPISAAESPLRLRLELPPGELRLRMESDSRPMRAINDPRTLVFFVRDFRVTAADAGP